MSNYKKGQADGPDKYPRRAGDAPKLQVFALDTERLPPSNMEAEMGVLGSVLLDNDALHDVIPILKVEDFYRDAHQCIYRAVRTVADAGQTVDAVTVSEELTRTGDLARVGGVEFLADTIDSGVCHMAHFEDPDGNALMLHHRYAPHKRDG